MNNRQTQTLRRSLSLFLECEMKAYEKIPKVEFTPSPEFQAKIEEYNRAIEDETSSAHKRIRWRIIGIAAVISIMLLITACCFGNTVIEFIKERFSTHTDISISSDLAPTTIEKAADINIIPEEYLFVERKILANSVSTCWSNGEKSFILFQNTLVNYTSSFDTEASGMQEYCFGTYTIYHAVNHSTRVLLWKNDEYVFTLTFPDEYDWTFLENVILDIEEDFK